MLINKYLLTYDNNDKASIFLGLPNEHSGTIYRIVRSFSNNLTYYITGGDKQKGILYCIVKGTQVEVHDVPYWALVDEHCYVETNFDTCYVKDMLYI